jgi:DNA repair protein RecO (recombination protein O)
MRWVTPAVVVGTVDYGDSDRVVTLFSRDLGRITAMARGARKSQRRFAGGAGLFGVGEASLSGRPGAEMLTLVGFEVARGFPALYGDVAKVAHGAYVCELVRELAAPHQPEPSLFELLVDTLAALDGGQARAELLRVFELRLLDLVGLRPTVDRCVVCDGDGALDRDGQRFDARKGGVVCAECEGGGFALAADARQALCDGQLLAVVDAASWHLAGPVNAACREALIGVLLGHLGRPLRSLEFIAKLNAS